MIATPLHQTRRGGPTLRSGQGVPPAPLDARAVDSAVHWVDLSNSLGGTLHAGVYTVTAIAGGLKSNHVVIRVSGGTTPPKAADPSRTPSLDYWLSGDERLSRQVHVPERAARGEPLPLRVALQVTELDGVRVEASPYPLWPCNLVLVELDERPLVAPLWVPVQPVEAGGGQARFNAIFEIDLTAVFGRALEGTYLLYLDAGKEFAGPYRLLVDD
jgi:hypothetical protein